MPPEQEFGAVTAHTSDDFECNRSEVFERLAESDGRDSTGPLMLKSTEFVPLAS